MDDKQTNIKHPTVSTAGTFPGTLKLYLYFDQRDQSKFNDCAKVLEVGHQEGLPPQLQ